MPAGAQNVVVTDAVMGHRPIVGSMAEYNPKEDWELYKERLDQFFEANQITHAPYCTATLITLIGTSTYRILRDLCSPVLPKEKTYAELCQLLRQHFTPAVAVFKERIEFYSAKQEDGETINDWYLRIKSLASNCNFHHLEDILKDKFVTGMLPGRILSRICEEDPTKKDLEALKVLAQSLEVTLKERDNIHFVGRRKSSQLQGKSGQQKREVPSRSFQPIQKSSSKFQPGANTRCYACGETNHNYKFCKYKRYKCTNCSKFGHISKVCAINIKKQHFLQVNDEEVVETDDFPEALYNLFKLSDKDIVDRQSLFSIQLEIENIKFCFEVDTGASVSILPEGIYKEKLSMIPLRRCSTSLQCYDGKMIIPLGSIRVNLCYQNNNFMTTLLIVNSNGPPLLGRDLISRLGIKLVESKNNNVYSINVVGNSKSLNALLDKYEIIFRDELGKFSKSKVSITVPVNTKPIFCKPYNIPFAYKAKVEQELDRLEKIGVITKVETNNWGTPLVPIIKKDNSIRLCANYKITVNKFLDNFNYPIPLIEDIFVALQGGVEFTKLDLSQAYNQLIVDDQTKSLLAWSTHKGVYLVERLPFGVKTACAIFQKEIDTILKGLKGVCCFIDDIIITGSTRQEHLQNLEAVLVKLAASGIKVKLDKCEFFKSKINYLGYVIDREGLHKDNAKIQAIKNVNRPENVTQLKAFIGMVNYYGRFIKNLANILKPLYELLRKDEKFRWNKSCEEAMEKAKDAISSDNVLIHFNPKLPLQLACDASMYGIGAVLSHIDEQGMERPIAFTSRILSKAEQGYSMLDKEALAIYYGIKKFSQYLLGHSFTLLTDHKPLVSLFGENKDMPALAASRLQRWGIYISNYDYKIKYIKGTQNSSADALSRMPLVVNFVENLDVHPQLNFIETEKLANLSQIQQETQNDTVLKQVYNFIMRGWPKYLNKDDVVLKPYFDKRNELTVEENIIMLGYRIVIPEILRKSILEELHSTHLGINKTKSIARSYFWWSTMNKEIENLILSYDACLVNRPEPQKLVKPWPKTNEVFERIHLDFAGPFKDKYFLIIIDSFSKWPEIFQLNTINTKITIEKLRETFARYGIPKTIVSDNGRQFTSSEMKTFCENNGIKHVFTPPYHPNSNGAAENTVKTFKASLNKALKDPKCRSASIETLISRYLLWYRNAMHSTTGESPAQKMFGRKLRMKFDRIRSNNNIELEGQVTDKKQCLVGAQVYIRDYRNPKEQKWIRASITKKIGEVIYECEIPETGTTHRRHRDQIIQVEKHSRSTGDKGKSKTKRIGYVPKTMEENKTTSNLDERSHTIQNEVLVEDEVLDNIDQGIVTASTRPKRNIRKPDKLDL
ncbi:uncharacterized protein K02A2.6-like [Photinus pyralis]|uniref:uncharacterized protein K02A2.6-like n=1 Tax=Photinus pyralis TaxID=7054 RepID=UPI0012676812|nr:uncharacterized protein K02A2.6-like [Photinus pyralis]